MTGTLESNHDRAGWTSIVAIRGPRGPFGPDLERVVEAARRASVSSLAAGRRAADALRPMIRQGAETTTRRAADAVRATRARTVEVAGSARLELPTAPARLARGVARVLDEAGFAPLRLLLSRHPGLAFAVGMPLLISSLFLGFWKGESAFLLGFWCAAMSLVFANHALRDPSEGTADPSTHSERENMP